MEPNRFIDAAFSLFASGPVATQPERNRAIEAQPATLFTLDLEM